MGEEILKDQLASVRRMLPELTPEDLLDYFERTAALLVSRDFGKKLGIRLENEEADQQYRMSLYSTKEEIVRRMKGRVQNG